jgi:SAM-dependent methyltransferase
MNEKVFEITSCEVCGNNELFPVLDLGKHPMCDDLVEVNNDRVCKEYPIEILFCKQCLTAHQRFQVPKDELFPKTYHYRSRFTADVLNGMKSLVQRTEEIAGNITGKKVLDIGCNDGSLLDFFKEKGAITFGIEPTDASLDAEKKGHTVYSNFLSLELAKTFVEKHGNPDFISFTNVFAHIEDLTGVIEALRYLATANTVFIIENHYLGSVLEGNQFDTFYHEHPRTYSFMSFSYIAKSLGFDILSVEFPSRYGGNIRVFIGNVGDKKADIAAIKDVEQKEQMFYSKFEAMNQGIERWKKGKKELIKKHVAEHGPLKAKAFPGRAAILVKLLDLNADQISATYEKPGSMKIGHYLPGTRIPILSDDDLFAGSDKNAPILNFAWHISKEIETYLRSNGYTGQIIDILSKSDFE